MSALQSFPMIDCGRSTCTKAVMRLCRCNRGSMAGITAHIVAASLVGEVLAEI